MLCIIGMYYNERRKSIFRPKGNLTRKQRSSALQVPASPPLPLTQNVMSPNKKTHQRSQSDATGLFQTLRRSHSGIY